MLRKPIEDRMQTNETKKKDCWRMVCEKAIVYRNCTYISEFSGSMKKYTLMVTFSTTIRA